METCSSSSSCFTRRNLLGWDSLGRSQRTDSMNQHLTPGHVLTLKGFPHHFLLRLTCPSAFSSRQEASAARVSSPTSPVRCSCSARRQSGVGGMEGHTRRKINVTPGLTLTPPTMTGRWKHKLRTQAYLSGWLPRQQTVTGTSVMMRSPPSLSGSTTSFLMLMSE